MVTMLRKLSIIAFTLALSACGGGGSGGGSSSTTAAPLNNFAAVTVDSGPAALVALGGAYNEPFVSVTICAPGSTTNCQTIDHVLLDTGSVGLRILGSVINASVLSALPTQTDPSGNPVGECYGYVDGYVFGSVRTADFTLGGGQVSSMPFNVIGDTGAFSTVPTSCSTGGGTNQNTVALLGANGVLGIGSTTTDCGVYCTTAGGYSAAIYYDCPASGCSTIIARASSTSAPFEQLPNPVAAMSKDNNGVILSLPSVPAGGAASVTGTLYFGIGTETNNGLGSATILTTTGSTSSYGPGLLTATYNGASLPQSFLDSGSTDYSFVDSAIPLCSNTDLSGYYCPTSTLNLAVSMTGGNQKSVSLSLPLNSAQILLSTTFAAIPGTGFNPSTSTTLQSYPSSFDFGLPFFYGRSVYVAIEGRTAAGAVGPYVAF